MNPLKVLLLVMVSTGLVCSAFAIERNPDTPGPAARSTAEANGAPGASIPAAPVTELGLPAEASYRLASAAAIRYAAADGNRIGARAAASVGGVAAPQTVRADTTSRGFRFSLAAMPEPTEWMQLLCGLVVAGFIARRRTNVVPD